MNPHPIHIGYYDHHASACVTLDPTASFNISGSVALTLSLTIHSDTGEQEEHTITCILPNNYSAEMILDCAHKERPDLIAVYDISTPIVAHSPIHPSTIYQSRES